MNEDRIIKVMLHHHPTIADTCSLLLKHERCCIQSANYVRTELPIRISHRVRDMQALPYIVVTQEQVGRVYEVSWSCSAMPRNMC
jgi:hypothetical protein